MPLHAEDYNPSSFKRRSVKTTYVIVNNLYLQVFYICALFTFCITNIMRKMMCRNLLSEISNVNDTQYTYGSQVESDPKKDAGI